MPLRAGQPVAAAQALGMLGDIHRGTPGVVVRVSYLGAYDVRFRGGRVVRGLRRDQLIVLTPGFGGAGTAGGAGGGCLLWLAVAVLPLAAGLIGRAVLPR